MKAWSIPTRDGASMAHGPCALEARGRKLSDITREKTTKARRFMGSFLLVALLRHKGMVRARAVRYCGAIV